MKKLIILGEYFGEEDDDWLDVVFWDCFLDVVWAKRNVVAG